MNLWFTPLAPEGEAAYGRCGRPSPHANCLSNTQVDETVISRTPRDGYCHRHHHCSFWWYSPIHHLAGVGRPSVTHHDGHRPSVHEPAKRHEQSIEWVPIQSTSLSLLIPVIAIPIADVAKFSSSQVTSVSCGRDRPHLGSEFQVQDAIIGSIISALVLVGTLSIERRCPIVEKAQVAVSPWVSR